MGWAWWNTAVEWRGWEHCIPVDSREMYWQYVGTWTDMPARKAGRTCQPQCSWLLEEQQYRPWNIQESQYKLDNGNKYAARKNTLYSLVKEQQALWTSSCKKPFNITRAFFPSYISYIIIFPVTWQETFGWMVHVGKWDVNLLLLFQFMLNFI